MGGMINQVLQPLTGVKLFGGGPYPDAGQGDVQKNLAAKVTPVASSFLSQAQDLPGLDKMGSLALLPAIISEIARKLKLSVKTVSTHRSRILEKTGLLNNAGIIRYVILNF